MIPRVRSHAFVCGFLAGCVVCGVGTQLANWLTGGW